MALIALGSALALWWWTTQRVVATPPELSPPPSTAAPGPTVRFARGKPPSRVPAPTGAPTGLAPASPAPAEPGGSPGSSLPAPRSITLESLSPEVRARLGEVALEHLGALAADCASYVERPQTVAAFVTLDGRGVLELELRPINEDAALVEVVDDPLPDALVSCLDEALWDQNWADAVALPEGTELPVALSLPLEPVSNP